VGELAIYTDGACSGNPGAGGWGVVMIYGSQIKELSGFESDTTNNRMELTAVISGLAAIKKKTPTAVYTDSKYIVDAINKGWLRNWIKNNWKNSQKKEVANQDLWRQLLELTAKHKPRYIWVKGHADNKYNNRCDDLAVTEIKKHNGERRENA
jgi:ribonuclease HI